MGETGFALMQRAQPATPVGRLHSDTFVSQRVWWRMSSTWVMISIIAGSSSQAGMESIKPQIDSNTSSKDVNMILLLLSGHRAAAAPRRQGLLFRDVNHPYCRHLQPETLPILPSQPTMPPRLPRTRTSASDTATWRMPLATDLRCLAGARACCLGLPAVPVQSTPSRDDRSADGRSPGDWFGLACVQAGC